MGSKPGLETVQQGLGCTISRGRQFLSDMVRGKNGIYLSVLCPAVGDVVAVCVVLSVA